MPEVKKEKPSILSGTIEENAQSPQVDNFCLAHISDLHLTSLLNVKCSQLCNKRLLGYLSWKRKRRWVHRREIVEALVKDLNVMCPQHIVVTGDLTHIGLPDEFTEAAQWLPNLGPAERVTVIPGNHEAYVGHNWSNSLTSWAPYLLSDSKPEITQAEGFFPSLRIRGQIALIGLCSARPSLPFFAVGSLGTKQLRLLAKLLKETGEAGLMRVVLVHHPPVPGTTGWRKRLVDDKAFSDVVSQHGAELVLHGHTHTSTLRELHGPTGAIPIISVPSASELNPRKRRCAGYNLYRIKPNGSSWDLSMTVRRYAAKTAGFIEERQVNLGKPRL